MQKPPVYLTIRMIRGFAWLSLLGGALLAYTTHEDGFGIVWIVSGILSSVVWFGFALLLTMVNEIRWNGMTAEQKEQELAALQPPPLDHTPVTDNTDSVENFHNRQTKKK